MPERFAGIAFPRTLEVNAFQCQVPIGTGWLVHLDAYLHEVHSSGASLQGCLSVARVSAGLDSVLGFCAVL